MKTEMSYLDLINKLRADIESDSMDREDKANALDLLLQLYDILWPYSA